MTSVDGVRVVPRTASILGGQLVARPARRRHPLAALIAAKLIWVESSTSRNVRIPSLAIAFAIAAVWWRLGDVAAAARCTYMTTYPSAIGRHTFLLATATSGVVTASVDTPQFYRSRAIP